MLTQLTAASPRLRARLAKLAVCSALLCAAATPPQQITGPDAKQDIDVFERAMTALHPGLQRSLTPAEFHARCDAARAATANGVDRRALLLEFIRLTAAIRCGHTFPNPYNADKALVAELFPVDACLPIAFRWVNRQMTVISAGGDAAGIPRGAVITALNGRPPSDILDAMVPLVRADGANDAKRVALLDTAGPDVGAYPTFDLLLPFIAPAQDGRWTVRYRAPGNADEHTLTVHAAPLTSRPNPAPPDLTSGAPLWTSSHAAAGVRVLTMPTWVLYKTAWNWQAWLDHQFDAAIDAGDPAIILDLRGNEGGSSVGPAILERLVSAPVTLAAQERRVRYRTVPADLNPHLDTWDDSFRDWGTAASDIVDAQGLRKLQREGEAETGDRVQPRGRRYTGKVIALIGPANSSATFEFARDAKALGLVTLVGQPTGGNLRGINGGCFFFLRLPHSRIEIDLPLIGQFTPPGSPLPPDRGVEPDIVVVPTVEDIARAQDADLTRAVEVARQLTTTPGSERQRQSR